MSNGVGLLAGLSGSIPAPRRTPPAESESRPPTRSADPAPVSSKRSRTPEATARTPIRVAETSGKPAKLRGVAGAERPASSLPAKASGSRAATAPLAASIERIRVQDPSRIRISLRPSALGEVRIELALSGSTLRARVLTATEEARALIQGGLDDLRNLLQDRGFRVREFRVETERSESTEVVEAGGGPGPASARRQVLDVTA